MKTLLIKELKLATSPLTFIFLVFTLMTFIPSYPILIGAFFVCLGIFQSFNQARVTNDILFTALLPIKKQDVVKAKYIEVCFFQVVGFILFAIFTIIRMTGLKDVIVYRENVMMNANLTFLGFVLLVYLLFNVIFVRSFMKTAYNINKPYILFVIATIILVGIAEAIHFIEPMSFLNDNLGESGASDLVQIIFLLVCAVLYIGGTLLTVRSSQKQFAYLDL